MESRQRRQSSPWILFVVGCVIGRESHYFFLPSNAKYIPTQEFCTCSATARLSSAKTLLLFVRGDRTFLYLLMTKRKKAEKTVMIF